MHKFFSLTLFLIPLFLHALEFRRLSSEEKINQLDLSFALTFDRYDSNADFALGNPGNIGMFRNLALGLRGIPGFDGAPAYFAEKDEVLQFEVPENLDPEKGSVVFFVRPRNYDQNKNSPSRGNVGFFEFKILSGEKMSNLFIYDFNGKTCVTWISHLKGVNRTIAVETKKFQIRSGEFYQIVVTWDSQRLSLYINGELAEANNFTGKASEIIRTLKPGPDSYLAVRPRIWGDQNIYQVEIDDVFIYRKVKTPGWIQNRYASLLSDGNKIRTVPFDFQTHGIDTGNSSHAGACELEFDLSPLEERLTGFTELVVRVSGESGFERVIKTENLLPKTILRVDGLIQGEYTVKASLCSQGGKDETGSWNFTVPDLGFIGNKFGLEDTVPEPWSKLEVLQRQVKVWNREYFFAEGPFPEKILSAGRSLLLAAPKLEFSPAATINWQRGATTRNNCAVEFTGSGSAEHFTIDYRTRVEFDGMMKTDLRISGSPLVDSVTLTWQVHPDCARYLKIPEICQSQEDPVEFPFDPFYPNYIWLTSEQAGFAFNYESDENWHYEKNENLFSADRKTGKCQVRLITRKIRLPEQLRWHTIFTATPTRPFPEKIRGMRIYDDLYPRHLLIHHPKNAFESTASFKASEQFDSAIKSWKHLASPRIIYYSMADALTEKDPVMAYFKKYWDIPGRYRYPMGGTITCSCCTATAMQDYLLANQQDLWKRPLADRFVMAYYDLCGASACANVLHGCSFKDAFGREIHRNQLLSKRQLILRTLRLGRRYGKQVMLHAQRSFYPPLHGLADYFYPGEEHGSILSGNPFGYTDEISDMIWKGEFDRDVLGCAIVMCSSIGWVKPAQRMENAPTEALLAAVLPYDIEIGGAYVNRTLTNEVFSIYDQLGVYDAKEKITFHRFDKQLEIISSDLECRISYYSMPGNRYAIVVANPSQQARQFQVEAKGVIEENETLLDCRQNTLLPVSGGIFKMSLPPRNYTILARYEGKKLDRMLSRSYHSDFSEGVVCWQDFNVSSEGAIKLVFDQVKEQEKAGRIEYFPVTSGQKVQYHLLIRSEGLDEDAQATVSLQIRNAKKGIIPAEFRVPFQLDSKSLRHADCRQWTRLEVSGTVPDSPEARHVALLMSAASSKPGTIWFQIDNKNKTE